ncbi:MAG: hypothetical protein M5U09_06295 [Gammaproteobacteria bacterium]|nr:hypothetical protein [Gammaproteobacteria bacterium]
MVITESGTELLRRMWAIYGGEIHESLERRLGRRDVATLVALLDRLLDEPPD